MFKLNLNFFDFRKKFLFLFVCINKHLNRKRNKNFQNKCCIFWCEKTYPKIKVFNFYLKKRVLIYPYYISLKNENFK